MAAGHVVAARERRKLTSSFRRLRHSGSRSKARTACSSASAVTSCFSSETSRATFWRIPSQPEVSSSGPICIQDSRTHGENTPSRNAANGTRRLRTARLCPSGMRRNRATSCFSHTFTSKNLVEYLRYPLHHARTVFVHVCVSSAGVVRIG